MMRPFTKGPVVRPRSLASLLLAVFAVLTATAAAGGNVYWRDDGAARIEPARITMSAGASGFIRIKKLRPWEGWGAESADATGRYRYNTCRPSCGAGNYDTTSAEVRLSQIRKCNGQRRYRHIRINPKKQSLSTMEFRMTCSGEAHFIF